MTVPDPLDPAYHVTALSLRMFAGQWKDAHVARDAAAESVARLNFLRALIRATPEAVAVAIAAGLEEEVADAPSPA